MKNTVVMEVMFNSKPVSVRDQKMFTEFVTKNEVGMKAYVKTIMQDAYKTRPEDLLSIGVREVYDEACMGLWEYVKGREGYQILEGDQKLFRKICHNQACNYLRSEKPLLFDNIDENSYSSVMTIYQSQLASDEENQLYKEECMEMMYTALDQLPPLYKDLLVLSERDGLPMSEIALRLGLKNANVAKTLKCRAVKMVRALLRLAA